MKIICKNLIFLFVFICTGVHLIAKSVRFTTYNIRREGSEKDKKNLWNNRKKLVFDTIDELKSDIIGFQEVVKGHQFDDLKKALPQYGSFGLSRSAKKAWGWQSFVMNFATDECNPLFYNKERISLLRSGDFGINPGRLGSFFPADLPRICTWGLFKNSKTGKEFYVYNTHLDNKSDSMRKKQIKIIFDHIKKEREKKGNGKPIILMGDLNTPIEKSIKEKIDKAHFVVAKDVAKKVKGPQATRTGWNDKLKNIDHILISNKNRLQVNLFEVIQSPVGIYPSDHRPVVVDIMIK